MNNIPMNTQMIKAILDGRKTQTRRVIKDKFHYMPTDFIYNSYDMGFDVFNDNDNIGEVKPKYQIGETIYIQEEFSIYNGFDGMGINIGKNAYAGDFYMCAKYRGDSRDGEDWNGEWREANSMPGEMARIFLKVTDVRVKRLQDISDSDIIKEGVAVDITVIGQDKIETMVLRRDKLKHDWINLWNKIAPKGYKWEDNPYVFVYEFERVENG